MVDLIIARKMDSSRHQLAASSETHPNVLKAHWSEERLLRIFLNLDPSCPIYKGQPTDYKHIFWASPKLSTFWANIFDTYDKLLEIIIPPSSYMCPFLDLPLKFSPQQAKSL